MAWGNFVLLTFKIVYKQNKYGLAQPVMDSNHCALSSPYLTLFLRYTLDETEQQQQQQQEF